MNNFVIGCKISFRKDLRVIRQITLVYSEEHPIRGRDCHVRVGGIDCVSEPQLEAATLSRTMSFAHNVRYTVQFQTL